MGSKETFSNEINNEIFQQLSFLLIFI